MSQSKRETPVQESKKPKATVFQSVVTGSVAGAVEVAVDHPLWSIKTRLQCGDAFTLKPSVLYRGILPNAASMVPITAMQVGLNRGIQNVFFKNTMELSNFQRVTSAFVAGVGSAFVSCPTEMVMTYQGKAKCGFYPAYGNLVKQGGLSCLFAGLPATAMRDGTFAAFFLAVTPILKAHIQPYCSNEYVASLMAGMGAGAGATVASQGVDTIKTIQQASNVSQPVSLNNAAKKIYSTNGIYGFFKGGVPRGARVMSAVTIMGLVTEKMEAKFRQK